MKFVKFGIGLYNLKKDEIILVLKNVLQLDNDITRTNTRPRSCSISYSNVESAGKRRLLSNKIRINNKMSLNKLFLNNILFLGLKLFGHNSFSCASQNSEQIY